MPRIIILISFLCIFNLGIFPNVFYSTSQLSRKETNVFYSTSQPSHKEICVYCGNNEKLYECIEGKFIEYGIVVKRIDRLDKHNKNLHIIFDAFDIPFHYFPENYIVYQTLNLDETPLTKSYVEKLEKAIAIWDPSWKNITKYSLLCEHYYFIGELLDPLMLPCLIPLDSLPLYKEILNYSNTIDTHISSHLPILFAHCIIKQPRIVIEAGVQNGDSTFAFKKILEKPNTKLIGIDIDGRSANVYRALNTNNAEFKTMDDIEFALWWKHSNYSDKKADIIFIDTSHHYDHTLKELEVFMPLLDKNGLLIFHDSNMCPQARSTYQRINKTHGRAWDNKKGVIRAIKEFFSIEFNEEQYSTLNFSSYDADWSLLHYPFCNGLTLIKRLN